MIEFENVDVTYPGGFKALHNVSLTIGDDELQHPGPGLPAGGAVEVRPVHQLQNLKGAVTVGNGVNSGQLIGPNKLLHDWDHSESAE